MEKMLTCLEPRSMAGLRLICVPYAGAGPAAFYSWVKLLPKAIEPYAIALPGREHRLDEAPLADWGAAIEAAVAAVRALPPGPILLYGHSMGAVMALDLARELAEDARLDLRRVFCAAMVPPTKPLALEPPVEDDELVQHLEERFGTAPPSFGDPEIRALLAPTLRADLALLSDYRPRFAKPLDLPLSVLSGVRDPFTAGVDSAHWRSLTTGETTIHEFDAGHFFLETHGRELTELIAAELPG